MFFFQNYDTNAYIHLYRDIDMTKSNKLFTGYQIPSKNDGFDKLIREGVEKRRKNALLAFNEPTRTTFGYDPDGNCTCFEED